MLSVFSSTAKIRSPVYISCVILPLPLIQKLKVLIVNNGISITSQFYFLHSPSFIFCRTYSILFFTLICIGFLRYSHNSSSFIIFLIISFFCVERRIWIKDLNRFIFLSSYSV